MTKNNKRHLGHEGTKRCFGWAQHDKVSEGAHHVVIPSVVEESHLKGNEGSKQCFDKLSMTKE